MAIQQIYFRPALREVAGCLGIIALVLVLGGCKVQEKKDGENKKVAIQTPLGDMKVNTDADVRDTGLSVYPGSRVKPDRDGDQQRANVNINTSFFGLKVVAITFESDDPPEKIVSFYSNEMKKYGDVLQCNGGSVGNVNVESGKDGELKCDSKGDGSTIELKVGVKERQRVVAVKPSGKGSEFSLVYVQTRDKEGSL